jgi:hypothetical protein
MWFSTDCGITRYNANNFKTFSADNGLPDNTVFEVMEDLQHRLWFRTLSGGVGYIKNDSVYTLKANKEIIKLQGKGLIQSFAIDSAGNLILGRTGMDGCYFIKVKPPYSETNVTRINSTIIKNDGIEAWIVRNKIVFAEKRGQQIPVYDTLYNPPHYIVIKNEKEEIIIRDSLPTRQTSPVTKFIIEGNQIVYTSAKILRVYNQSTGEITKSTLNGHILTTYKENNRLFLGLRFNGVQEYDLPGMKLGSAYLDNRSITCIKKDLFGGYWYSTLENGVYYCPQKKYTRFTISDLEKEKSGISSFAIINDTMLVVGAGNREIYTISRLSDGKMVSHLIDGFLKRDVVVTLVKIEPSRMLVGNIAQFSYLYELLPRGKTKFIKAISRYKIIKRMTNYYACIAARGIELLDTINLEKIKEFETSDRITSIAEGSDKGLIYIGGRNGLYEINVTTGTINPLFLQKRVEDLVVGNGKLFVGTKTSGILVKEGNNWDTITTNNNLLSNVCRRVFYNNTNLWVLTNEGISRVNYKGYKNYQVKNYPFSEMIFPESIEDIQFTKASAVFCDGNSVHFFPLTPEQIYSPFRISDITLNKRILPIKQKLELEYYHSDLVVNFEALFYNANRVILYRYKFNNDGDWQYTEKTSISFPALAPGTYPLKLQVRSQEGEWTDCENKLTIIVKKPFWQRWWFILCYTLVAISLIILLVYLRFRKAFIKQQQKAELTQKMNELEMRVIKAQMDPHFISNCLAAIQELIYKGEVEKAGQYIAKFSFFIRQVLHYSDQTYITLKQELEIINLNIELEQLRFKNNFDVMINISEDVEPDEVMIPSLITQPFVENAVWHGLLPLKEKRNPKLSITIYYEQELLFIVIEDNGVGRKPVSSEKCERISKGTRLAVDKLESLNKLTETNKYKLEIVDLKNDQQESCGTKIIIQLLNYTD